MVNPALLIVPMVRVQAFPVAVGSEAGDVKDATPLPSVLTVTVAGHPVAVLADDHVPVKETALTGAPVATSSTVKLKRQVICIVHGRLLVCTGDGGAVTCRPSALCYLNWCCA